MIMRIKGFAIGAAGFLAAGAFTVVGGVHSVSANCAAGPGVGPAPVPSIVGTQIDGPAGTGCLQVGVTGSGVVYNPVGGSATSTPVGVYVIAQGEPGNPGSTGYVGISNAETGGASGTKGPSDPPCQTAGGNGGSSDSNGGGSVGVDPLAYPPSGSCGSAASSVVGIGWGSTGSDGGEVYVAGTATGVYLVAPVACGQVSGSDWTSTTRDGCWEP
jgi:hypothetical protein